MFRRMFSLGTFMMLFACGSCERDKPENGPANSPALSVTVSTVAGDAKADRGSTDGQGAAARFWDLGAMTYDTRNNKLYFVDDGKVIRCMDAQNNVTTYLPLGILDRWDLIYAISTAPGSQGGSLLITTKYCKLYRIDSDAGTAKATLLINAQGNNVGDFTKAQLDGATGITTVPSGKTYFFNSYYNTMHRISFLSATTGNVEAFAGKPLASPYDPAYPFQDGQGEAATFGGGVSDMCSDISGNLFVADYDRNTIRKVTPTGSVTSVFPMQIVAFDKDGPVATAQAHRVKSVSADQNGNIFFTTLGLDASGPAVRVVLNSQNVVTLAGNNRGYKDGDGKTAAFGTIGDIAVTPDGKTIYVADHGNNVIRKITIK